MTTEPFTLTEEQAGIAVTSLSTFIGRFQNDLYTEDQLRAAASLRADLLEHYEDLPGKVWRQGSGPLKVVAPDGRHFNLRVDDERAAFFDALNESDT